MSSRYRKTREKGIPSRWLHCPPKSLQLLVDKFLIFKTPLSRDYDVPDECLFPVSFVFQSTRSYKLKLGLWIDLTNTNRFYDKQEIEQNDCKYVKLQCRGFGETPSVEQTQTFNAICHNFLTQRPLEKIGVHCTHGFNRSGFMLVSFLVEKFDWELGAALLKFSEVRPPGIYKKDYLVELYKRYDDVDFAPEPPPLPDWCYEDEERDDHISSNENADNDFGGNDNDVDDEEEGEEEDDEEDEQSNTSNLETRKRKRKKNSSKGKKRKVEFVLKNPVFMAGVPGVEPVTEPTLGEIQKKVQMLCDWKR